MTLCPGGIRLLFAAVAIAVCTSAPPVRGALPEIAPSETRALWVLRTSLTSPVNIAALVAAARDNGFNTLLVQVRGRGDAYYRSTIEPVTPELARQPATFDPLAAVIAAARAHGIRVHAWVNLNLVSSAVDLPSNRAHIVHRHPEWLMVPRDLAQELGRTETSSPGYIGRLARWTRERLTEVEGLYVSPINAAAAAHTERVVRDIASRYDLDGVHFDYARYPTDRFDYSRAALREFRNAVAPLLPEARRRELDAEQPGDLLAYPDALPDEWRRFRVQRMTALIARLRAAVKEARPPALVSVAAAPGQQDALTRKLQDWGGWVESGLIDALCPMAYTQEPARFAEQIAEARGAAGNTPVWAGIGAYRLSPAQTIHNIHTARRLGAAGVVLFSYDSLVDPQTSVPGYLSTVGRTAFASRPSAASGSR